MRFKTLNELPAACKKNNPQLFGMGPMAQPVTQPDTPRPLARRRPVQKRGEPIVVIILLRCGWRRVDDDNLAGGFKPLRDAIARSLDIDDDDPRVLWEYAQIKTSGPKGTFVMFHSMA